MATAVPYPFAGTPQYQGNVGQSRFMHNVATPQMQGPTPSSTGYGSRFTPNWQANLPSQGPGAMPGTAAPRTGPRPAPPTGSFPPAPGGPQVWGSNRPPVSTPAAPAVAGRGLLGSLLRNPIAQLGLLAGPAAYDMVADRNNPIGDAAGNFLGLDEYGDFSGPQDQAPMPSPEMAMNAAPPPMSMAMAPSMAGQIPTPGNPAPMAQPPMPMDPTTMIPQMSTLPPMPAPMQQAPMQQAPMQQAPMQQAPMAQPGGVWSGQNQGIQDDTRARAMAWLALQQGMQ